MLGWPNRNERKAVCLSLMLPLATCCTAGNDGADWGNGSTEVKLTRFGTSRRIATGRYGSLLVDPWDDRVPVAIAFDYTNGDAVLAIRPLDGRLGCNAGAAFTSKVFDKRPNRVQLVAYASASADGPVLKFVDHNCGQYGPSIAGAALPSMLYLDPPAYLVEKASSDGSSQLLVVDPWNGTSRVLASNVTWYSTSSADDSTLWMLDGGHYKVFDGKQQQLCDIGTAVTEIQYQGNNAGPFFLVDSGVLYKYQSLSDAAPVQIAGDACQLAKDEIGALYYFSPCSSRQLQRYHFDSRQITAIDSGVSALVDTQRKPGTTDAYVLYTKPNAQGNKDLWLYSPDAPATLVVPGFNRLYDWSAISGFSIIATTDVDGVTGSLIQTDVTRTNSLLDGISVEFPRGLLAHFDASASTGDLYTVPSLGTSPQFVASGVPYIKHANTIIAAAGDPTALYGAAVIANATGAVGDLQLIRYPYVSSPGPESPVTIAQQSPVGTAQFFEGMTALAYFGNWTGELTGGQGSLCVRELTEGVVSDIADAVREFREVRWPSEAILYTTWDGDSAGIWISNAQ